MPVYPYYQIVTFGSPAYGNRKSYYRKLEPAIRDAATLSGGSLQNVRVVGCNTPSQARTADIGDPTTYEQTVWSR